MFGRKNVKPHVPAKVKAFGRARLEIAERAQSREDWESLWKPPMQPFPFEWGPHWKQCIEYRVDDFIAEVGFLIDVLGLPVNAFNPDYAMFTSPDHEFYFAVVPAGNVTRSTPADALRIQFMVADIFQLTDNLKLRNVEFDQEPTPVTEGSEQWVASFRTPHGINIEIWGLVEMVATPAEPAKEPDVQEEEKIKHIRQESEEPETREGSVEKEGSWFELDEDLIEDDLSFEESSDDDPEADAADSLFGDEDKDDDEDEKAESEPAIAEPLTRQKPDNGKADLKREKQRGTTDKPEVEAKPVRLLPRAAVEPRSPEPAISQNKLSEPSSFRPAPKKAEEKKVASIWDEVSHDVEYHDLENSAPEDYHYKPIPLNREE